MNNSKIMSIVIATIAAALVMSSIHSASHVFAKKDGTSSSGGGSDSGSSGSSSGTSSSSGSGSSTSDYDNFQKCLSDAATGGSAAKQQIKDCFDSTYGSGSSSGGSSSSGNTDNSGSSSDTGNNPDNTNNDANN
ncbi:MAG: hypothetical protein WAL66_12645 [Nitrososphaeraceae archaeon]